MRFDQAMVPYCGKIYTGKRRADRILHETTGHLMEIKTLAVILDGVIYLSEMSACHLCCSRAIPSFRRESQVEDLESEQAGATPDR